MLKKIFKKASVSALALTVALGASMLVSCGNNGSEDGKVSDTDTEMVTENMTEKASDNTTEGMTENMTELETGTSGTTENGSEHSSDGGNTSEEATTNSGMTDSHARNRTIMPQMGK